MYTFFAGASSEYDSASGDVSEFCPSHEDEITDESAELSTEELVIGYPNHCPTQKHQSEALLSSVQSNSFSDSVSLFGKRRQGVWELHALHRRNVLYL